MDSLLATIGIYLGLGIISLTILDLLTGRIRGRLKTASYETQEKLIAIRTIVSIKTAFILTIMALWIFWPIAIYAAIRR